MKKITLLFILFANFSFAQTNLPNLNFETWQTTPIVDVIAPFTTLNKLNTFGAPLTVTQTTDAHEGTYAAKLETKEFGSFGLTILLSGLITTGTFTPNITDIQGSLDQGTPFEGRPDSMTGWYKYLPASTDSGAIVILLTKWNSSTNSRDTIGSADYIEKNTVSNYTYLSMPVEYFSTNNPDSIIIVFSSSAGGGSVPPNGFVGSTMFVDDFKMVYNSVGINSDNTILENINFNNNTFFFENSQEKNIQLYNHIGQVVFTKNISDNSLQIDLPSGVYFYSINQNSKGKIIVY